MSRIVVIGGGIVGLLVLGFSDRVLAAAAGREAFAPPGPSRDELLGALA